MDCQDKATAEKQHNIAMVHQVPYTNNKLFTLVHINMKHLGPIIAIVMAAVTFFSPFAFAQNTNLGDVLVRFCNDETAEGGTTSLSLTADAGDPEEICLYLSNSGEAPVTVRLNFVDGTITADADQRKACQPEGVKEQFGQYVSIDQNEYTLDPGETIQTTATVTFPEGLAGMNYGCVTSQIIEANDDQDETDSMFRVLTRKANFIDVLVEGNIELGLRVEPQTLSPTTENLSDTDQIVVYEDPATNKLVAQVGFRNIGNIPQEVTVQGTIADVMNKHALPSTTKKILPQQTATFTFPIDNYIPLYEGLMDMRIDVTHQPIFEFESENITDEMRQTESFSIATSFVLIPRNIILIILAVLVLLWLLTRRGGTTQSRRRSPRPQPSPVSPGRQQRKQPTSTSKTKDKLTKIQGIGPKTEQLLYDAGITTYADLSTTKVAKIRNILEAGSPQLVGRSDPNDWKKQATLAKHGKRDELEKMQNS